MVMNLKFEELTMQYYLPSRFFTNKEFLMDEENLNDYIDDRDWDKDERGLEEEHSIPHE